MNNKFLTLENAQICALEDALEVLLNHLADVDGEPVVESAEELVASASILLEEVRREQVARMKRIVKGVNPQ